MENIDYREKLLVQIKEAYGKITYTYTTHLENMNSLKTTMSFIKIIQIVLSAISTVGFLATVITDTIALSWISGIISVVLLAMNLYLKDFNLSYEIQLHQEASDKLWIIREKYISLLTDLESLSLDDIIQMRDIYSEMVAEIYATSPKTNYKSYKKAKKALKKKESQYFTNEELNMMLPEYLRTK